MGHLFQWGILVVGKKDQNPTLRNWNIYLIDRTRNQSGHTGVVEIENLKGILVLSIPAEAASNPFFSPIVEALYSRIHLCPLTGQEK